jgi:DNA modification methylase
MLRKAAKITKPSDASPAAPESTARAGPGRGRVETGAHQRQSALLDTRVIYCGDCLDQLRKLPGGCVDLVYIDPPFNSNRNYEVFWGETKEKRAFEDRHASTAAYIDYMRPRCVELARVLKKTGSFYYHCDWHACHYVKVMLDQLFGENLFQNEIIWKRTSAHSSAVRYGPVHDTIFFYTGSNKHTWNPSYQPYEQDYLDNFFEMQDDDGRRWKRMDLTGDGVRNGESGETWKGVDVTRKGRHWAIPRDAVELYKLKSEGTLARLDELDKKGAIHWPQKSDGVPRLKQYADAMPGVPLQTVWNDIRPIHNLSQERLGYPTQKPLALLERIVNASSNPNDIVLDAFCGCGTALVAAQNLGRQWIGIDISPTACRVMAKRLRDVCGLPTSETSWRAGKGVALRELPYTLDTLRKMPPFEFENWAVIALGGIPNKAQVGDMGIDGRIFPVSAAPKKRGAESGELEFMDHWYPIQVKQKDRVGRPDIDSFEAVMAREDRTKGFFVAFDYSSDALTEIDRFFRKTGKVIVALSVREILDEQIAKKLV